MFIQISMLIELSFTVVVLSYTDQRLLGGNPSIPDWLCDCVRKSIIKIYNVKEFEMAPPVLLQLQKANKDCSYTCCKEKRSLS